MDPRLDATAQAELVRSGEVSARELVEGAIERVEALNPELNAVIHERFEQALAEGPAPTVRSGACPSRSRTWPATRRATPTTRACAS